MNYLLADFNTILKTYDILFITDERYNFLYGNNRFMGLSEITKSELTARNLRDFLAGESEKTLENIGTEISRLSCWKGNVSFSSPNGSTITLEANVIASTDGKSNAGELTFFCRHVHTPLPVTLADREKEKKETIRNIEGQLKRNLEDLLSRINLISAILDTMTSLVVLVDSEGKIIRFNKSCQDCTGFQFEEAKGKFFWELIPAEEERDRTEALFSKKDEALLTQRKHELLWIRKSDSARLIEWDFRYIRDRNGETEYILCSGRDITEYKEAENKLIEINRQIAEYKLMALRSVMNPHFLFNALNSIQYFIAKSERKLALDYLSIFSALIRKILDSSVNNTITLSKEMEILEYYISLEILRFENKFDFEISVSPEVDPENIEIPSLLIQPYVENAILHGLTTKEEKGTLTIAISKKEDRLIVVVEDNGIGREQARNIRNRTRKNDKSYGLLVTQERLDIINQTNDVSVSVEDLLDAQGSAAGTRVTIGISL